MKKFICIKKLNDRLRLLRPCLEITFLTLVVACGGQLEKFNPVDNDTSTTQKRPAAAPNYGGMFIKAEDFDLSKNTKQISKTDLEYELSETSELYNSAVESDSDEEEEEEEDAFDKCFDFNQDPKIRAETSRIEMFFDFRNENCQFEGGDSSKSITSIGNYYLKSYAMNYCQGHDYSSFDGKTWNEIDQIAESDPIFGKCLADETRWLYGIEMAVQEQTKSVSASTGEITTSSTEIKSKLAVLGPDNGACVVKKVGGNEIAENCSYLAFVYAKFTGSFFDFEETNISKIVFKNLVTNDDESKHWYGGGSIDINLANWAGTITYSGFDQPGQFSLRNGQDQVSGSLPRYNSVQSLALFSHDDSTGYAKGTNGQSEQRLLVPLKDGVRRLMREIRSNQVLH